MALRPAPHRGQPNRGQRVNSLRLSVATAHLLLARDVAVRYQDSQQVAATKTQPIDPSPHNTRLAALQHLHPNPRPHPHFLQTPNVLGTPDKSGHQSGLARGKAVQRNRIVRVCSVYQGRSTMFLQGIVA